MVLPASILTGMCYSCSMKILMICGTPDEYGTVRLTAEYLKAVLEQHGLETEMYQVRDDVQGCTACGKCYKTSRCAIEDDVNMIAGKMAEAGGLIAVTPVVYGRASGKTVLFLERLFRSNPEVFSAKPAAAVPVMRRRGKEQAYEQLLDLFAQGNMLVLTSASHFVIAGTASPQSGSDEGENRNRNLLVEQMSYVLQCIRAGKEKGLPEPEEKPEKDLSYYR